MLDLVDSAWSVHARPQWPPFPFSRFTRPFRHLVFWGVCALCAKSLGNSSSLVHCAQNPWEIPAMRPNRPAEEGDGTGWGLISVTVTLLIPKKIPIGIGISNFGDRYR